MAAAGGGGGVGARVGGSGGGGGRRGPAACVRGHDVHGNAEGLRVLRGDAGDDAVAEAARRRRRPRRRCLPRRTPSLGPNLERGRRSEGGDRGEPEEPIREAGQLQHQVQADAEQALRVELGVVRPSGHARLRQPLPATHRRALPVRQVLRRLHQPLHLPHRPLCPSGTISAPVVLELWRAISCIQLFLTWIGLQPSMVVFKDMLHELEMGRENPDGADQGFLVSYFPDLLDRPMFHPPANGSKIDGTYRLPLGYQMDASYYYLKLRWNVPCGPNSVITFPSLPWLKPWYWWSWPILPLGLQWHEQRRSSLGYAAEAPAMLIQAAIYLGIMVVTRLARPGLLRLCYSRRSEKSIPFLHTMVKVAAVWSMFVAHVVPFFLVPRTVHPLLGWPLYLLGAAALCSIVTGVFLLPALPVLTLLLATSGSLFVMAFPWYSDGIIRVLVLLGYAFCCAPVVWASLARVVSSLHSLLEREAFFPRLGESTPLSESSKAY